MESVKQCTDNSRTLSGPVNALQYTKWDSLKYIHPGLGNY